MSNYQEIEKQKSKIFRDNRYRELALHLIIYVLVNVSLVLDNPNAIHSAGLGKSFEGFINLTGINHIPWLTVNWGVILIAHIGLVIGMTIWQRTVQQSVEQELNRRNQSYHDDLGASVPNVNHKRKRSVQRPNEVDTLVDQHEYAQSRLAENSS